MRISDWSSDVCSSDLTVATLDGGGTISLWLAQDDGEPVFLDDRSPSGATQLLSEAQFDALADHEPDVGGERLLRNIVLTVAAGFIARSEEHTSELQSLMRISYAVFCLKKKQQQN